jgi:hypothetical protein
MIFVYAMSMLSRYRVQHWDKLLEGKETDINWRIQEYLTSTQTFFPNLIFNQLQGRSYYFFPVAPELMEMDGGYTNEYDWMR